MVDSLRSRSTWEWWGSFIATKFPKSDHPHKGHLRSLYRVQKGPSWLPPKHPRIHCGRAHGTNNSAQELDSAPGASIYSFSFSLEFCISSFVHFFLITFCLIHSIASAFSTVWLAFSLRFSEDEGICCFGGCMSGGRGIFTANTHICLFAPGAFFVFHDVSFFLSGASVDGVFIFKSLNGWRSRYGFTIGHGVWRSSVCFLQGGVSGALSFRGGVFCTTLLILQILYTFYCTDLRLHDNVWRVSYTRREYPMCFLIIWLFSRCFFFFFSSVLLYLGTHSIHLLF